MLEALELDQATLVTLSRLDEIINQTESPISAAYAGRLLRERGWLLPLRTSGVWEFAPSARAGAWGGGDPFIESRARLANRPIETAFAAESVAWLHGFSVRAPEPHVIALPTGVNFPRSLDGFRVVRWSAADPVVAVNGLLTWFASTLLAFMGARPDRYRDWPNVREWLAESAGRVHLQAPRESRDSKLSTTSS